MRLLRDTIQTRLDLEMAATEEIINIALEIKPELVTIVPEKRMELTTEGGLDVISFKDKFKVLCDRMHETNIEGTLNFTDEFLLFQSTEKSATGFGGSSSKSLVVSINDIKSINLESKMFGMSNNLIIKSFNSELNELLSNDNSTVSLGIAKSDVDTAKEIVNKFKMI